jgi:hypothetical protein
MKIAISPGGGLSNRTAMNPFQNPKPSFSIFAAVSAHTFGHSSPTITKNSYAAAAAKCTCEDITNPPSLPVLQIRVAYPDCNHFRRAKATDQGAKIKRELEGH